MSDFFFLYISVWAYSVYEHIQYNFNSYKNTDQTLEDLIRTECKYARACTWVFWFVFMLIFIIPEWSNV